MYNFIYFKNIYNMEFAKKTKINYEINKFSLKIGYFHKCEIKKYNLMINKNYILTFNLINI